MTAARAALSLVTAAFAFPSAAQDRADTYKPPTEAQCRAMVEDMRQTMKSLSPPGKPDKGAEALLAKVEKAVAENRARGKSECDSWAYIMKTATNQ